MFPTSFTYISIQKPQVAAFSVTSRDKRHQLWDGVFFLPRSFQTPEIRIWQRFRVFVSVMCFNSFHSCANLGNHWGLKLAKKRPFTLMQRSTCLFCWLITWTIILKILTSNSWDISNWDSRPVNLVFGSGHKEDVASFLFTRDSCYHQYTKLLSY